MASTRTLLWARRYMAPPSGREVRRLIAWVTLAVGIPRLPFVEELVQVSFAPQRFGQPAVFGVVCVIVGALLIATAYHGRLQPMGRICAALGFVVWMTLAAATTSATSLLIDLAMAASLLVETGTWRRE